MVALTIGFSKFELTSETKVLNNLEKLKLEKNEKLPARLDFYTIHN